MGFKLKDLLRYTPLGIISHEQDEENKEEEAAQAQRFQDSRTLALNKGLETGRIKAENLYGLNDQQIGADTQDVIRRRREALDRPSRAAAEARGVGAQQLRQATSRGASEAQKRQISYDTASRAGLIEEQKREENLTAFQRLIGNIAANKSALELSYGSLGLSSQYIPPPQQNNGLLTNLLGPLI